MFAEVYFPQFSFVNKVRAPKRHVWPGSRSVSSTGSVPNSVNLVEGNAGGNPPDSSIVKTTDGMRLAANSEDKPFYSVDTFQDSKIRH
jgi:hypothetical protein